jgi:hypothetical protein
VTGVDPGLEGVPETLLWTLWHGAARPARPRGVLVPLATRVPFARTALLSIWAARSGIA